LLVAFADELREKNKNKILKIKYGVVGKLIITLLAIT